MVLVLLVVLGVEVVLVVAAMAMVAIISRIGTSSSSRSNRRSSRSRRRGRSRAEEGNASWQITGHLALEPWHLPCAPRVSCAAWTVKLGPYGQQVVA